MLSELRIETFEVVDGVMTIESISLLDDKSGLGIIDWQPAVSITKDDGVWMNNPMSDGRRLTMRTLGNVTENMTISVGPGTHPRVVQSLRKLRQMLEKAVAYWTTEWLDQPVWIMAREYGEANARYALIYDYRTPQDSSALLGPFSCVNAGMTGLSMPDIELTIERGHWLSDLPTTSHCVEASGMETNYFSLAWAVNLGGVGTAVRFLYYDRPCGKLFACTGPNIRWTSDGSAWNTVAVGGANDVFLGMVRAGDGYLYAGGYNTGTNLGILYRSNDCGLTWATGAWAQNAGVVIGCNAKYMQFVNGYLYVPWTGLAGANPGLWRTIPGSGVWTNVCPGTAGSYPVGFYYSPLAQTFFCSYFDPSEMSYGFMTSSLGDGSDWINIIPGNRPLTAVWSMVEFNELAAVSRTVGSSATQSFYRPVIWGSGGSELFKLTSSQQGIVYTDPNGMLAWAPTYMVWKLEHIDPPIASTAIYEIMVASTGRLLAVEDGGYLFESNSGGESWTLPDEFPQGAAGNAQSIAEFDDINALYVGTNNAIYWSSTSIDLGRQATCLPEVFWRAGRQELNLTHIWRYDDSAGTYTQLFGRGQGTANFSILPAVPTVDDAVYFGIDNSRQASGDPPFKSLIFDLATVLRDSTGAAITAVWEYYNGAWVAMTNITDNTNTLKNPGVQSVWFGSPVGWTAVAVNGITGLWIRLRVTVAGAAALSPQQQNRDIYSVTWSHVEIDDDQTSGDITTLARYLIAGVSDRDGPLNFNLPNSYWNRMLIGLRSVNRGELFQAYHNFSDVQNAAGIVCVPMTASTVFADDTDANTGRLLEHMTTGVGDWRGEAYMAFAGNVAVQHHGKFLMFAKVRITTGTPEDMKFRAVIYNGSGGNSYTTRTAICTDFGYNLLLFGEVQLPANAYFDRQAMPDHFAVVVEINSSAAASVIQLHDLTLIPIDEWAADMTDPRYSAASPITYARYLDIDSVTSPKVPVRIFVRKNDTGGVVNNWIGAGAGGAILQHHAKQRLWFLPLRGEVNGTHTGAGADADLEDTGAYFDLQGVKRGSFVYNVTDGSQGIIERVERDRIVAPLYGGTDNDWDNGDTYWIFCKQWANAGQFGGTFQAFGVDRYLSYRGE